MIAYTVVSVAHVLNRRTVSEDLKTKARERGVQFTQSDMWSEDSFYALAVIQKISAIVYYVVAINIAYSFTEPLYFNEEYWVKNTKKRRGME